MGNITIPKKLAPIVDAFFVESPQVARTLIMQAAKAIYESDSHYNGREVTSGGISEILAFMHGIRPNDMFEALIAAQIVVTHMLGLHKLAQGCTEDMRIGMKMLQFSSDSMARLQKKRSGGMQNVTVNYN